MKDYCTQNDGDCLTCSLTNYGRDCQNNPINPAAILGKLGGQSRSDAKAEAARKNGAKGGRPRKTGTD